MLHLLSHLELELPHHLLLLHLPYFYDLVPDERVELHSLGLDSVLLHLFLAEHEVVCVVFIPENSI